MSEMSRSESEPKSIEDQVRDGLVEAFRQAYAEDPARDLEYEWGVRYHHKLLGAGWEWDTYLKEESARAAMYAYQGNSDYSDLSLWRRPIGPWQQIGPSE